MILFYINTRITRANKRGRNTREGSMICLPLRATSGAEKGNYGDRHLGLIGGIRKLEPMGVLQRSDNHPMKGHVVHVRL